MGTGGGVCWLCPPPLHGEPIWNSNTAMLNTDSDSYDVTALHRPLLLPALNLPQHETLHRFYFHPVGEWTKCNKTFHHWGKNTPSNRRLVLQVYVHKSSIFSVLKAICLKLQDLSPFFCVCSVWEMLRRSGSASVCVDNKHHCNNPLFQPSHKPGIKCYCLVAQSTMWSSCDCINRSDLISRSHEWEREGGRADSVISGTWQFKECK